MKKIYIICTVLIAFLIIGVCVGISIYQRLSIEEFAYSTPLNDRSGEDVYVEMSDNTAYVMPQIYTLEKVAALTFSDVPSIEVAERIMDVLDKYEMKATFFLKGSRIYEEPDLPKIIAERGFYLANETLTGKSDFDKLSEEEMAKELAVAKDLIEKNSGVTVTDFRCYTENYSEQILKAAFACGLKRAVPANVKIDANTIETDDEGYRFIKYMQRGSVISVNSAKTDNICNMLDIVLKNANDMGLKFISLDELESKNDKNLNSYYNENNVNLSQKQEIISRVKVRDNLSALTFDGLGDKDKVYAILDALDKCSIKATFFMSGEEVIADTQTAKEIISRGHEIGSNLMSGKNIDSMDFTTTYAEVKQANDTFGKYLGIYPKYIRPKNGRINKYISSVGVHTKQKIVTYSKNPLDKNMISAEEILTAVKYGFRKGDIIILNTDVNPEVARAVILIYDYMNRKGFTLVTVGELYSSPREVEKVLVGEKPPVKTEKDDFYIEEPNTEEKADVFSYAYTTAKSVAITFDGIGNEQILNSLLDCLEENNIRATFFVSAKQVEENVELVQKILDRGNEVESNTYSAKSLDENDYSKNYSEIYTAAEVFKNLLNIDVKYVRPAYGRTNDKFIKAAKQLNQTIVTYSKNPLAPAKSKASADEMLEYLEKKITRGEIIRLTADNEAILEVIPRFAEFVRDLGYDFVTIDELYNSQYEVKTFEEIPNHDKIKINHLYPDTIPEFIETIPNDENKVFLTFDDWGSDKTITSILDTLEKNDVKASFFLRAAGTQTNVNLARAMSEGGHDIASHTFSHTDIIEMSKEDIQEDLYKAHKIITESIGRCPELYMRPPRLYENADALRAVKAMGFTAIMSADVSSHDWEHDLSGDVITDDIIDRTQSGTIIILHLLDDAKGYQILDDLIFKLRQRGFDFAPLSEYLG